MSIASVFGRQHGIITRSQARAEGLSNHQIDRLIRVGEWVPVDRGVFRNAAVPLSWRGRVAAAVARSNGVASHRCAAALWGLEVVRRPLPELTISSSRRAPTTRGVIVHRSSLPRLDQCPLRHGIRTTPIERTLFDCSAVVSGDMLERLAESAIRQQLTSWQALSNLLEQHGAQGRDGTAPFRRLLASRSGDPVVPRSDFSRGVVQLLERSGVSRPQVEYAVHGTDGRYLLLADLAWPQQMRIVELDGLAYHFSRQDRERDIDRRAEVRAAGWRLLELGWKLYRDEPDRLVRIVTDFLRDP